MKKFKGTKGTFKVGEVRKHAYGDYLPILSDEKLIAEIDLDNKDLEEMVENANLFAKSKRMLELLWEIRESSEYKKLHKDRRIELEKLLNI